MNSIYILFVAAFIFVLYEYSKKKYQLSVPQYNDKFVAVTLTIITLILGFSLLYNFWSYGFFSHYSIAGIIPWSDASNYAEGAQSLWLRSYLTEWCGRRPFFGSFLAGIFWLTSGSYFYSHLILTTFVLIAIAFATISTYGYLGIAAALWQLAICLLFFKAVAVSTFMSESLGLILGCLSFVAFIKALKSNLKTYFILGLFLLGLGQCARAGTIFVLPLLILVGPQIFNIKGKEAYKFFFVAFLFAFLPFVINKIFIHILTISGQGGFSNFWYSIYGIAKGGENWSVAYKDYPELINISDTQASLLIKNYAIELIKADPSQFLTGLAVNMILSVSPFFLGSFAGVYQAILVIYIPVVVAVIYCIFNQSYSNLRLFILSIVVGIFFSAPFLRDGQYRVYAVTIPSLGFIAAFGFVSLLQKLSKVEFHSKFQFNLAFNKFFLIFTSLILFCLLIVPFYLKVNLQYSKQESAIGSCQLDLTFISWMATDSVIHIKDGGNFTRDIELQIFNKNIQIVDSSFDPWSVPFIDLRNNQDFYASLDLKSGKFYYYSIPTETKVDKTGLYVLCGNLRMWRSREYVYLSSLHFIK